MSVTQKPSRRRWIWLIPGGLVIVGLVVFFAWWQYFKTTPAYALALLVDASQQDDRAAFDRVVNLDRVIDNFVAQGAQDSGIGLTTTSLVTSVRVQVQSLAPAASAVVKEGVREEIRNRINELAGPAGARPFVATALAMPFLSEINQTGETAQVRINRTDEIELVMERREGSDWQVTSLQDQALARRVVTRIVKQLPQSESEFDKQMGKQLRTLPEKLPQLPLLP
jgi:hypothetical protein